MGRPRYRTGAGESRPPPRALSARSAVLVVATIRGAPPARERHPLPHHAPGPVQGAVRALGLGRPVAPTAAVRRPRPARRGAALLDLPPTPSSLSSPEGARWTAISWRPPAAPEFRRSPEGERSNAIAWRPPAVFRRSPEGERSTAIAWR